MSKEPFKNKSNHSKEVMEEKVELLALHNTCICNFSCQNLYCFNKNASLVVTKQPINHLKLV